MKLVSWTFPRRAKIAFFIAMAGFIIGIVGFTFYKAHVVPPVLTEKFNVNEEFIGPMPADSYEKTGDTYTILVAGRDEIGYNTDTIMVVSFDTTNYTIDVVSIPRDTMSAGVTRTTKKINAAYGVGNRENPEQLILEVENMLGFSVDRYMVINLEVLVDAIDILGGVEIDVSHKMFYYDPAQELTIDILPGIQTLNGYQAMGFVRYRTNYAEGDLRRIENQQQFIDALADAVLTPSVVTKLPTLISTIFNNLDTDFTIGEIAWLAQEALNVDLENDLNMHVLPGYADLAYGLSYYFVYQNKWITMLNESFNPLTRDITISDLKIQSSPPEGSQVVEDELDEDYLNDEDVDIQDDVSDDTDDVPENTTSPDNSGSSGGTSSENTPDVEQETPETETQPEVEVEPESEPEVPEEVVPETTEPSIDDLIGSGINPEEINPNITVPEVNETTPQVEETPSDPWDV